MPTPNLRLRTRRKSFPLTQTELASQVGVAVTSVRRWEAGWQPQPEHIRRLCAALHASPAALGLGADIDSDPPVLDVIRVEAANDPDADEMTFSGVIDPVMVPDRFASWLSQVGMDRRHVLLDLGMLGFAASIAGTEVVRRGLEVAFGGDEKSSDVDDWEQIAHEYARSFYDPPTDRLLRDLTADLSVLRACLQGADSRRQRTFCRIGGQLGTITAMAWASAGEGRYARRWWQTARWLADRSDDTETRTWVRGWEVANGLYEQRAVPDILDRAEEAVSIAGAIPCAGSAGLYAGLAQTLAVAGRADEALTALQRVADVSDRLPADVVGAEDSMLGWPEVRLRHTESYVYTWLGDTTRAYAAQDRALSLYPEHLARERAAMLLHRAACMIRDGDVGGGLSYAVHVLETLPKEQCTELVCAIGRSVMQGVPAKELGRPEAAELRNRLASAPAGRRHR